MTQRLTKPMRWALNWLAAGNEVSVSLIDFNGYSAEMPRRNTLQALADRGLVDVTHRLGAFDVVINDRGRDLLQTQKKPAGH